MTETLYHDDGLMLTLEHGKYYLLYDAGAHQIAMRKDEITKDEAEQIIADPSMADHILFQLQKALSASGVDPYTANVANT